MEEFGGGQGDLLSGLSWTVTFMSRGGGSAEGPPQTMSSREVALLSDLMAASRDVEGDGASDWHSGWDGHSPSPRHRLELREVAHGTQR